MVTGWRAVVASGSTGAKTQTREQQAVPDGGGAGFWFTALRQAAAGSSFSWLFQYHDLAVAVVTACSLTIRKQ